MRRLLSIATAVLLAAVDASAHPNSVSYAHYALDGRTVHAVVRLPLDDVDLLLRLDRNLDGEVSRAELDTAALTIRAYLARHMRVTAEGVPLMASPGRFQIWHDAFAFAYLESDVSFDATRAVGRLAIHTDLLADLYPAHKTLGRISLAGREERFTFDSTTTYQRHVAPDHVSIVAAVVGSLVLLGLLLIARRRTAAAVIGIVLVTGAARGDVIMSAGTLNTTLKTMEKLKREAAGEAGPGRAEAWFRLGAAADGLASIMNLEVESHGMQERELLDLALDRTKELGVAVAYHRDKKKFFYDGAAFAEYLKEAPRGRHAATAEFKLLSYRFYQSSVTNVAALAAAVDATKGFLARYPRFAANAEVRLYLAVDYRDLHRRCVEEHDSANADKWRRLARAECLRITRQFPRTEQSDAARQLLRTLSRD